MPIKAIGNFPIHPIGIGTYLMGGGVYPETKQSFADYSTDKNEIEAIRYSIRKGQNHIDGAQFYGAGHTDELIGEAIKGFQREKLFIASKIWKSHALRNAVVPATKDILKRMQVKYLDLLYIHAPFTEVSMYEYIMGLNDALDTGLVKNIGVSNFDLDQLKQAMEISKHPIVANQIRYNVLYKTKAVRELLNFCNVNDILIVAYRPIERRLLADNTVNDVVLQVARKYSKTPAQIALNWLITQKNIVSIPKASRVEHIDENLKATDFELAKEDFEKLSLIDSIE